MKRRISAALLSLCLLMSLMPSVAFAAPNGSFDDVDGHWGQAAVERWAGYGVVNGDGSGNFNPDNQMTRAEFATMLANMLGYKEKAANTFSDVNDSDWFADAILKLAAAGVMQGSNGMANPNAPITRQEAAVLMCRAFNIPTTGGNLDFADSADVADWAKGAVAALADRGMMNGVGNNNVAPLADINRASVATLLNNMITEYVTEDKEITGEVTGIVLVAGDANVTLKDATLAENLIVAPKADGAELTLTGSTSAKDVYVDASAAVKVDSNASAGAVQVGAANSTVDVAGKADSVTLDSAAANTSVNVNEGAAVGDVAVNAADSKVNVAKDATVDTVAVAGANADVTVSGKVDNVTVAAGATGTGITANSGATVGKVETSANDVTVSGSGKVENVTANDGTVSVTTPGTSVENKTDSADNVTNNGTPVPPTTGGDTPTPPSGNGGGGPTTPAKKYNVSIASATGGTVTAAIAGEAAGATGTDTANTTVTLTVTPNAQNGDTMPYVLKSLKMKAPGAEGVETDITSGKTFTMNTEGTYTVTAEFEQPLTEADLFVVKDPDSYAKLEGFGYTSTNKEYELTTLAAHPWLAIGVKKNASYPDNDANNKVGDFKVTANNNAVDAFNSVSINHYQTFYLNTKDSADDDTHAGTVLALSGAEYNFKATFTYKGAYYTLTENYQRTLTADEQEKLTNLTVVDINGQSTTTKLLPGATYTLTPGTNANRYFTGWDIPEGETSNVSDNVYTAANDTKAAKNVTIEAKYVNIGNQAAAERPKTGPGAPTNDWEALYNSAGLDMTGTNGTYALTIDASKLIKVTDEQKTALTHGASLYYGVQFTKPANATKLVFASDVSTLTSGGTTIELSPDKQTDNGDVLDGVYIDYFLVATKSGDALTFGEAKTWTRYFKWMKDEEVLAVNKVTISRPAVNATVNVKVDGNTAGSVNVPYNTNLTEANIAAIKALAPAKAGYAIEEVQKDNVTVDTSTKLTADTTLTPVYQSVAEIIGLTKEQTTAVLTDGWAKGLEPEQTVITLTPDTSNPTTLKAGTTTLERFVYTGFSSNTDARGYVVVAVKKPAGATLSTDKVVVRAGVAGTAAYNVKAEQMTDKVGNADYAVMVMVVADKDATAATDFNIWVKWDGMVDDSTAGATQYTIDLSGVTFKAAESPSGGDSNPTGA